MFKRLFCAFILSMLTSVVAANPSPVGDWQGKLDIQPGVSLTLVVHIEQQGDTLTSTLDSPDQGSYGIPVANTQLESSTLTLDIAIIGAKLVATVGDDTLKGTFTQAQQDLPITLSKLNVEQQQALKDKFARPQMPKAPFPYEIEEVTYPHLSKEFDFAATLTLPEGKGPFPLAILVTGSGPQDRDETLAQHKPFWVLADHLTRQGIAVLRSDDRGTGESGGDFSSADLNAFVTDIHSAYQFAAQHPNIDKAAIGIIGHSEGGVTGPMFAAQYPDKVAFMIMMAGLGVDGTTLWATQQSDIAAALGMADPKMVYDLHHKAAAMAANGDSKEQVLALFTAIPGMPQAQAEQIASMLTSPWGRSFTQYQPNKVLPKLTMPLLAVNGDKDIQVTSKANLAGIKDNLAKADNNDVTVKEMASLNHLFQKADTGLPNEYILIQETLNPQLLNTISDWLTTRFVD